MLYSILRKFLFSLPPEVAHTLSLLALRNLHQLGILKPIKSTLSSRTLMGMHFPNIVGLAAGLDKNGEYIDALSAIGFGFVEIGTVTPKAQEGNPRPRLFRLIKEEALINRLGFNNKGLDYLLAQLTRIKYKGILGINIGKNKETKNENAIEDYLLGFRKVAPFASYVTINLSSPNTPGLRDLQRGELLKSLLNTLKEEQAKFSKYTPLVLKISPDLSIDELTQVGEILLTEKIDGVIATNTTIDREAVKASAFAEEAGGLSGKPLFSRSTQVVRQLREIVKDQIPIIACGGIFDVEDVKAKILAGASLVQFYTGFIYRGPELIKRLVDEDYKI